MGLDLDELTFSATRRNLVLFNLSLIAFFLFAPNGFQFKAFDVTLQPEGLKFWICTFICWGYLNWRFYQSVNKLENDNKWLNDIISQRLLDHALTDIKNSIEKKNKAGGREGKKIKFDTHEGLRIAQGKMYLKYAVRIVLNDFGEKAPVSIQEPEYQMPEKFYKKIELDAKIQYAGKYPHYTNILAPWFFSASALVMALLKAGLLLK